MTVVSAPHAPGAATAHAVGGGADDRMNRNAMALVVSSVATSVLGFAFWVLAARTMSKADVGTASALVASVVLLGNMSTLGLRNALQRFLPEAGGRTRSMILSSYATVAAAGLVVAGVFVAGAAWWADDLTMVRSSLFGQVAFAFSVAAWAVFILQDSVLIGLRQAHWVPVENAIYAVAKLGLLVAVASTGSWALLIAWMVPAVLLLGPLNLGILTRLTPAPGADTSHSGVIGWRGVARFAGGDHFADVVRYLGAEGVVLIVFAHLGPEASAPLFFAITIAASLQLVSSNVMSAFVAEASARPGEVSTLLRRATVRIAQFVVPGAFIAAVAAPIGLAIFGEAYVDDGTTVLRLLLLATIPQIVISVAIGLSRFERRVSRVVAIAAGTACAPIVGAVFLVPRFGIVAVGWATLVGQCLLATIVWMAVLRPAWTSPTTSGESGVVGALVEVRGRVRQARRVRAAASLFDELDATRESRPPLLPRSILATDNDVVVARVDDDARPLIVKVALSDSGSRSVDAHAASLATMHRATTGSLAQQLLPEIVEVGTTVGQQYVVETACRGVKPSGDDPVLLASVAAAFSALHRATARPVRSGDELAHHLVEGPAAMLRAEPKLARYRDTVTTIAEPLKRGLGRPDLVVARTHGDCWLGNVLIDPSAPQPFVSGVVDWENSLEHGLPEVDLAHLWLSSYRGGIASGTLHALTEGRFVDLAGPCATGAANDQLPAGLVVTLAWLAHVADGMQRASTFTTGGLWLRRTVIPVLEAFHSARLERLLD